MPGDMPQLKKDKNISLVSLTKKYPGLSDTFQLMMHPTQLNDNYTKMNPETSKTDYFHVGVYISVLTFVGLFLLQPPWLHENSQLVTNFLF